MINLHQLDFNCTELNEIFRVDNGGQNYNPNVSTNVEEKPKNGKGGGRKGIEHLFPSIPGVATEFIKSQEFPFTRTPKNIFYYKLCSICNSS